MARSWDSSLVREMLARADQSDTPGGRSAYRPDTLPEGFGLLDDGLYRLSDTQDQEILNMRLQCLAGLEQYKIVGACTNIMDNIAYLMDVMARPERLEEDTSELQLQI